MTISPGRLLNSHVACRGSPTMHSSRKTKAWRLSLLLGLSLRGQTSPLFFAQRCVPPCNPLRSAASRARQRLPASGVPRPARTGQRVIARRHLILFVNGLPESLHASSSGFSTKLCSAEVQFRLPTEPSGEAMTLLRILGRQRKCAEFLASVVLPHASSLFWANERRGQDRL